MKTIVVASGLSGVPVVEELLKGIWKVEVLYYDKTSPHQGSYEEYRERAGFPVTGVSDSLEPSFWKNLALDSETVLLLINHPEPDQNWLPTVPDKFYCLHTALLPRYTGRNPIQWALYDDAPDTGITLYRRMGGPYTGEIIFQEAVQILEQDDISTLEKKLNEMSVGIVQRFFTEASQAILRGHGRVAFQSANKPWPPRRGSINWKETTQQIHDFVRAQTHPYPGAITYLKGRKLTVWKTMMLEPKGEIRKSRPGEVYTFDPFRVWTGDGLIQLQSVQWDGEDEMKGTDFARTRSIEPGLLFEEDQPQG
ncbi:MAG TPA: formyltransferase family protein [Elusimicrobiota bacterium]|nr:formyltransferase family protein [Elusimicrobiota bacterium]